MGIGWGAFQRIIRARFERLEHFRPLVLAAIGCASLACLIVAGRHTPIYVWTDIVVACGAAFLPAVFALRHAGLAMLIVLAPLPGLLLFLAALPASDALRATGYCLGMALVVSVLFGEAVAASATSGEPGEGIPGRVVRGNSRIAAALLIVFLIPALAFTGVFGGYAYLEVAGAVLLTIVSAAVVVPLGAPVFEYGEDYVARANRSREMFARLFAPILPVARPRFGFSVFGIGCVITAIAFFGAKPLFVTTATAFWPIALVVLLAAATSFAVLRDWRRCLAVLLSAASAIQIAIWPVARAGAALTSTTAVDSLTVVSIIFVLQLFQAQEASGAIATEDDAVAGFERAIETRAMAVCVAGAVGIAALLPFSGRDLTTWGCCAVGILAGVASAVLFQPAIAITVESLVPRAATIAGRYRL